MRYLKLYEHFEEDRLEIKNICEEQLAFLLDDGFTIDTGKQYRNKKNSNVLYPITIKKHNRGDYFKWNDIKDDIIPFLEKINTYYTLCDISGGKGIFEVIIHDHNSSSDYYKYQDVITDDMSNGFYFNFYKLMLSKNIPQNTNGKHYIPLDLDKLEQVSIIIGIKDKK
jgi:hypothetical protein